MNTKSNRLSRNFCCHFAPWRNTTMAPFEMTHCYDQTPHLEIIRCLEYLCYPRNILSVNQCRNNAFWHWILCFWKTPQCVKCMDTVLCFLLKHRNIIATNCWILLLKPLFVISQGQQCWHTFHALMSAKNKCPIKCVKPKLTPLYFNSSHAWYAWLLYYKIQQFFLECIIMNESNNNYAFS